MKYFLGVLLLVVVASGGYLLLSKSPSFQILNSVTSSTGSSSDTTPSRRYIEIQKPSGYVNTSGITIEELIGKKVILLDILTYSCINCIRTFPYLNAWYDTYKDSGLEIIGIHTPEFAFEKKLENVKTAMEKYGIKFPIVLDNEYATWNAYGNRYWPRKYLIDIEGNIVYDHIGEGGYAETEKKIQELLEERKNKLGDETNIHTDTTVLKQVESPVSGRNQSPETYFGAARNEGLGNGNIRVGVVQTYTAPEIILPNTIYLVGDWTFSEDYAINMNANAKIIFRYQAQKVFFVASDDDNTLHILQDGEKDADVFGSSVQDGSVSITADDLYRLIENDVFGEHTIEIQIEKPGLQVFTFTFG